MRDKSSGCDGRSRNPGAARLRKRIRSDLERKGVAPQFSEMMAERLEPSASSMSAHEYSVMLDGVATAYGVYRGDREARGIAPEDATEIQRLLEGFGEEVRKLDEGLRILSAYVTRLRNRALVHEVRKLH